jgi:diguanylate cyclase (GGDEF)-like protein/PAS domain S-box-containing protein
MPLQHPIDVTSLATSHEPWLVALSIVVASLASYVALDMAGRTSAAGSHTRPAWLAAGSMAMGVGIWSMHFIGMLAFRLHGPPGRAGTPPVVLPIAYDVPLLVLSVVVAIGASALALAVVSRTRLGGRETAAASLLMGGAIAGMHYLGMAAMRMPATLGWRPWLVVASLGIAAGASYAALWLAKRLGNVATRQAAWVKGGAATVMGLAIAGVHYTGMAATRFGARPHAHVAVDGDVLASPSLAGHVIVAAVLVLLVALLGAAIDRGHHAELDETLRRSEDRFRSVSEAATDAIVSTDAAGHIVFWNRAAARLFGYTESEALGRKLSTLIGPKGMAAGGGAGVGRTMEIEAVRRDGTAFPIELSLSTWASEGQTYFTSIIRDITARRRIQEAIQESELRYRRLVEGSPECIIVHAAGRVLFANPAAAEVLAVASPEALIGRELLDLVHEESRGEVRERIALAAAADGDARAEPGEFRVVTADGRVLDVETVSVPVVHDGRRALQTHVRDVTPRKALERQLVHEAFHDPLTGLANRLLFRDRVEHALSRASRGGPRPVVLFLDLDNFKHVNDGWGHVVGDRLLVQVAARVLATLRAADTCARLGGDEFAVLLEEVDVTSGPVEARAAHVASRVVEALVPPLTCDGAEFTVGVSVGIAVAALGDSADDVLRNADLAMYRAKAAGKGRYEMFEPAMHAAVRDRLELEGDLRRVVERGCDDLVVHYQPIASIADGRIVGFEALVRWSDVRRGLVPPGAFISIAEETGLIVPIGHHVLRVACREARRWRDRVGESLSVTVNLSARQLVEPDLPHAVAAVLAESGLAPEYLVLEMTESMLIDDSETTLARLLALKALGVRLAIDDFGTGFSSLGYLERFPVDLLKIDKSFVDKVGLEHDESPLARAILGLGGALGMRVVAEGIETEAQWTRLRELGCELGQGFYLATPVPADGVDVLLDADRARVSRV